MADGEADKSSNSGDSWLSGEKPARRKTPRKSLLSKLDRTAINLKATELEIAIVESEFFKIYNKSAITGMFTLVFVSNILINVDHGSLPGCSV